MKVIFINRFFYPDSSATSQILSDLAFELAGRNSEIHVITSRLHHIDNRETMPSIDVVNGVNIHRLKTTGFGHKSLTGRLIDYISFYLTLILKLCSLAKKGDIVIAKTDPPLLSLFVAPVVKIKQAKLINWLQDIYPEVAQNLGVGGWFMSILYYILRILRNISLRAAEINIVPGKLMYDYLHKEGIRQNRLHIIPNWSDGTQVQSIPPSENRLLKAWGLDGKFIVGYSGNFGRAHIFETILAAAKTLSHLVEGKNIIFLLIGGGARLPEIRQEIVKFQLTNICLQSHQPRESLAQSLSAPDIHLITLKQNLEGFIVPSKFYGIAAAARATLFIGSKNGEIPSILQQHNIGTTIPEHDSDKLVSEILKLKSNTPLRQAMGQRARKLFDLHYDKKIAVQKWRVLLGNISAN